MINLLFDEKQFTTVLTVNKYFFFQAKYQMLCCSFGTDLLPRSDFVNVFFFFILTFFKLINLMLIFTIRLSNVKSLELITICQSPK